MRSSTKQLALKAAGGTLLVLVCALAFLGYQKGSLIAAFEAVVQACL